VRGFCQSEEGMISVPCLRCNAAAAAPAAPAAPAVPAASAAAAASTAAASAAASATADTEAAFVAAYAVALVAVADMLSAAGRRILDVSGDGNCFYKAVECSSPEGSATHGLTWQSIKSEVISFIRGGSFDTFEFLDSNTYLDTNHYCDEMEKEGIWADDYTAEYVYS